MTVLVTGGSGFVGKAIVSRLLELGDPLILAQRRPIPDDLLRKGVAHAQIGDLSDAVDWGRVLEGATTIVHIAGLAHQPPGVSDKAMFEINAEATSGLARSAVKAGVRRFIFISSIRAVVGASSAHVVTDDTPPAPVDAYGRSKLEAERAIAATGIEGAILRPVLVIGAGAGGNLALLRRLAALPLPLPLAGLSGRRSMISDRSLADAVLHLLTIAPQPLNHYLAAHADCLNVGEIVMALRRARNRSPGLFTLPDALLAGAARVVGKSEMLERVARDLIVRADRLTATGWAPSETTQQALSRLA